MKCPACLGGHTEFAGYVDKYSPPLSVQRCRDCDSYFQFPLPENHEGFYDEDYYAGKSEFSYIDERKANKYNKFVWDARIKNIRKFVSGGIFVDVGCSFGGLVRAASPHFDSYGIDISAYAVGNGNVFSRQICDLPGFKGLFRGSLLDLPPEVAMIRNVSVITMIEVIEHLENPGHHIQKAYELLRPGGLLVIQTANMAAWQAVSQGLNYHYFLPGHLTCFSDRGLKVLLTKAGFASFREYFPVDFGLLPKLRKLSGSLQGFRDTVRLWNTAKYHIQSFFKKNGLRATSSYVVYAFKDHWP